MPKKEKKQQAEVKEQEAKQEEVTVEAAEAETDSEAATEAKPADKEQEAAEMMAKLVEKAAQLEQEAQKNYDLYLRALAETENYRKRAAKDKEEYINFASVGILKKVLGVVDDLERAMANADDEKKDYDSLKKGLDIISRNVAELLKSEGVQPIEALGKPFDPQFHQPLMMEPSADVPPHTVLQEFQRGYVYKERVIRPSLVKVSE